MLNAKQGDVSASFRSQKLGVNFRKSNEKLFYRPCSAVVEHHRKSVVKAHTNSPGVMAVLGSPLRVGVIVVV